MYIFLVNTYTAIFNKYENEKNMHCENNKDLKIFKNKNRERKNKFIEKQHLKGKKSNLIFLLKD